MKPARPARRPLVSLRQAEIVPGGAGLFLGRLDRAALEAELEQAGVLAGLAARGYPQVVFRSEQQAGEHRLTILPPGRRVCLLELRAAETTYLAHEALLRGQGIDVLSLLSIRWLMLQDPGATFTAERPRLPGQRHPGLGLSKRIYEKLEAWARQWGKDGLLTFPEYYHNAVFYSARFRFLSPEQQGAFEALRRDLGRVSLAEASRAVDRRQVRQLGVGALAWAPGEMVAATSTPLASYLDSAEYRRRARARCAAVEFRLG